MGFYAEVKNDIVQRVIVADEKSIISGIAGDPLKWIETKDDGIFRKQYACIGDTYDKENDVFLKPQPFPSWKLDKNFDWQPPSAMPTELLPWKYEWNEGTKSWVKS